MYRTDKQFMKNPATANARIYIGNLPKTTVAIDLEAKFSGHGKILGLVINTGFAFIQYELEEEAKTAIRMENNTNMMGRKIIVRLAHAGKGQGGPPQQQQQQQPQQQQIKGPPAKMDLPPPRATSLSRAPDQEPDNRNLNFEPPDVPEDEADLQEDEEMDSGPNIRPPPQQKFDDRSSRGGRGGARGGRGSMPRNNSKDRFSHPQRDLREMPPQRDLRDMPPHRGPGPGVYYDDYGPPQAPVVPEIVPATDRNDCEIIVVTRALTEYAEFIEGRLKHLGLLVDLLFPNEAVPIGRVLANVSSRGCLYAILIAPHNEEHRSLTLNVLHGLPQEHRNMPIDDALLLMQRNFEAYMRGEKAPEDPSKMSLADRHPAPIQMLFNLLAENRQLSSNQYERLLKYLQERRQLQYEHEISEGLALEPEDNSKDKQNELQTRILSILNKSNEPPIPTSITAPDPMPQESSTPLLKDPSVQKALESILSGDMFKGIAGGL
ncbi:unnamed protein product [Ceutorhynchus assimilis]|uniref:RRM domain-containing protein n=1 Tax=Ceutorhynchus assimilis TaxID=467358 RepID=A0A9N9MX72_9CUCU|nr:unnamed protein product [Ceutorhynchus assimilis]